MLIIAPGWGMEAALYQPLRVALSVESCLLPSGPEPYTVPINAASLVGIGHSLGGLVLLRHLAPRLQALVLINGFARFTAGPDWPHGEAPRTLLRMCRRFATHPAETRAAFRHRVGAPPDGPAVDDATLQAGLTALMEWDLRAVLAGFSGRLLWLAAPDDTVVTPESARSNAALAGVEPVWHPGGHLLPWTEPLWCARTIIDWLR